MTTYEPQATALLLATCGLLLGVSVVFSRASQRTGVPIALLFIVVGMVAGSEGLGHIAFDDYHFAFRIGTLALALILFDGGLIATGAHALGLGWGEALLIGAVVSSTDAAAVFAVLRGSGLQLKRRVGVTLELESGINDPVAVILTVALTENLVSPGALDGLGVGLDVLRQLVV